MGTTTICNGQIKGDPDIAGIGVVIALALNAAVALVLSNALWLYLFPFYRIWQISSDQTHPWWVLDDTKKHPPWVKVVRETLVIQGDTLLISGLAVIIASLVNVHKDEETPLYHIFIARSLADVCLTGHVSAIVLLHPTPHNWTFRLFLTTVAIVLWEYWSWIAAERFRGWRYNTPHCMENANFFGGEYEDWIFLSMVWLPVNYLNLYLSFWQRGRDLVQRFEYSIIDFVTFAMSQFEALRMQKGITASPISMVSFAINALYATAVSITCLLYLAICILFPATKTLAPLDSAVNIWWDLYDIDTARQSNAHIVVANPTYRPERSFQNNENPEHDWGFGQIFPIVMLLVPVLTVLDILSKTSHKAKALGETAIGRDLSTMASSQLQDYNPGASGQGSETQIDVDDISSVNVVRLANNAGPFSGLARQDSAIRRTTTAQQSSGS